MSNHPPASCTGREESVHRFLDDDLTPGEREAFLSHLQTCQPCRAMLSEMQVLFAELESLEDMAAPVEIASQVMRNLPQPSPPSQRLPFGRLVLVSQMAAGLLLLLLAWPMLALSSTGLPGRLPWEDLSGQAISWTNWLVQVLITWGDQGRRWVSDFAVSGLTVSPAAALILIAILGLAWLAGNSLLLRHHLTSPKNGGAL